MREISYLISNIVHWNIITEKTARWTGPNGILLYTFYLYSNMGILFSMLI